MFETRSDAWAAAGLDIQIDTSQIQRARARLLLSLTLLIATIVAKSWAVHRYESSGPKVPQFVRGTAGKIFAYSYPGPHQFIFNTKAPFEIAAVFIVLGLGWLIAKDLSRLTPTLFKRMDPATAGTVEFLVRLVSVVATVLGAITIAGVSAQVVAVGGAFTAVIVGLAAQPVLGNLFAGLVLLSAQPFHLGDRIRLYAGAIGTQEGTVASLGLLYTSLARGANRIMIPNGLVLAAVVVPLREPPPVDVRVKLNNGVKPSHAQAILDAELSDDTLGTPNVVLEEIDGDDVFIRVQATPESSDESARLADDIIKVLASVTGEHSAVEGTDGDDRRG
ncbi:MAG TPA: mechanosensitive ion channel family protein [Solirubrobacteraceae bacterium]|nr:mechanosensitive ion channel family protein [Solirubrobacteraceae bacterium]